jgi:hypothetical protein
VFPVDDQLRPEHRRPHGDPDDRVEFTFAGRLNYANHYASEDKYQSPRIRAHHPFPMTSDVSVAHEFDCDKRAEEPGASMNPTDGIADWAGTEGASDEHPKGCGDRDRDEVNVPSHAMEAQVAVANSAGELNWRGNQRDEARNTVKEDPIADGAEVYPFWIGEPVVQEESFVVVEHEQGADSDGEIEPMFRRGKARCLHRRTSSAMELGFDSRPVESWKTI